MDDVGDGHGMPLCFTGGVAHAVDDGELGGNQDLRRCLHRFGDAGLATIDGGLRVVADSVLRKPGAAENAGVLGFGYLLLIQVYGQDHVVAHTAAERAGGVFDDLGVLAHASLPRGGAGSTCTSKFFDKGIPLPAVSLAISRLDDGP